MSGHALLSASGAHKWLHCSPSARLEQSYPDHETESAAEGTAAHALAEYKLKTALHQKIDRPTSPFETDEMNACTDDYVAFVLERIAQAKHHCADPIVLIEQHLDFSCYVPQGFGTGDVVIVGDGVLHIIDFKYGRGVLVDAAENPQMMLYALGALQQFGNLYDMKQARMTIFQPRRENVSTWSIPISELLTWADSTLKPRAVLAYDGKGDYCPGDWCTFCKAAVKCRARAESKLSLAKYEFALPPLLTDEEIEEILLHVDDIDLAPRNRASYNVRKKRKKTNKGAERRWQERTTQLNRSLSSYGKLNCIATRAKRSLRPVESLESRSRHITAGEKNTVE